MYEVYKSLHIIFVTTWFAGLFYMPRLFIYDTEAQNLEEIERKPLQKQFKIMQKRLWYGITYPSMFLAIVFGWLTLHAVGYIYLEQDWMLWKLAFVVGLVAYHFRMDNIFHQIQKSKYTLTSTYLRIWNEVATIFLVEIASFSRIAFIVFLSS